MWKHPQRNKKVKSFGLIEAIIACSILIILLTAAITLSSTLLRGSQLTQSYFEAEHIADDILERVLADKSRGLLSFIGSVDNPVEGEIFSIDCYDNQKGYGKLSCQSGAKYKGQLPYSDYGLPDPAKDYYISVKHDKAPSFPDNYFSLKVSIRRPSEMPTEIDQGKSRCRSIENSSGQQVDISPDKCRYAEIDIKWVEPSGEKKYYQTQYFADWEK